MSRRLPDTCINSALPQEDRAGVCRVHGGGFAGVIAAIVPEKEQDNYVEYISRFVGKEMYIRWTSARSEQYILDNMKDKRQQLIILENY